MECFFKYISKKNPYEIKINPSDKFVFFNNFM